MTNLADLEKLEKENLKLKKEPEESKSDFDFIMNIFKNFYPIIVDK